jgi:hypothetical protein
MSSVTGRPLRGLAVFSAPVPLRSPPQLEGAEYEAHTFVRGVGLSVLAGDG